MAERAVKPFDVGRVDVTDALRRLDNCRDGCARALINAMRHFHRIFKKLALYRCRWSYLARLWFGYLFLFAAARLRWAGLLALLRRRSRRGGGSGGIIRLIVGKFDLVLCKDRYAAQQQRCQRTNPHTDLKTALGI